MNKYLIILLVFSVSLNVFAQDLIPFNSNGKWGFSNSKGEHIIKATYDSVGVFNREKLLRKNVCIVKKNGAFNIINEQNVPLFDYNLKLKYIDLIESHIIVKKANDKFVAYDVFNYKLDTREFDYYDDMLGYTLAIENNGKLGLIDYKLETVIPEAYDILYFKWFYDRGYPSEEVINAIVESLEPTVVNNELYVDGEKVDYTRCMMILTIINENESKRVLKYIDTLSDDEKFEEEEFGYSSGWTSIESTDPDLPDYEGMKDKLPYNFKRCGDENGICLFSKDSKEGVYNLNTNNASELYDYIHPNLNFTYFTVTDYGSEGYNDSSVGLIDSNFEVLIPTAYKSVEIDYKSDYLVIAQKTNDFYDYYNLKTKKYIFKDSEYKKGDYIYGGSSGGKYYFPVEKNGEFYYVDEDGFEYKKPN